MRDATGLPVLVQEAHRVLDFQIRVDAVLVVEVDRLCAKALEALLELRPQSVDATAGVVAALGPNDDVVTERRERAADRALALPAGVEVRGVDEVDARLDRGLQEGAVLRCVGEAVAAQPDPGELEVSEPHFVRHPGSPLQPATASTSLPRTWPDSLSS